MIFPNLGRCFLTWEKQQWSSTIFRAAVMHVYWPASYLLISSALEQRRAWPKCARTLQSYVTAADGLLWQQYWAAVTSAHRQIEACLWYEYFSPMTCEMLITYFAFHLQTDLQDLHHTALITCWGNMAVFLESTSLWPKRKPERDGEESSSLWQLHFFFFV